MNIPTGLSASQVADYRQSAARLVERFDTNRDGRIDRLEADRRQFQNRDSYSFSTRISGNYNERTTITQEHSLGIEAGAIDRFDRDRDGRIGAEEIVESYLNEQDNNRDGNLSYWEKLSMSASGMLDAVQRRFSVEVDRTTRLEYSPSYDYDYDYRPSPPSPGYNRPDYDRPSPPSPGYSRPDYDRPSPPSPGYSRPDYDRPSPPSPGYSRPDYDRPSPPRPSSPSYDRPTPPSSGSRPTPPSPSGDRPRPPRP